MHIDFILKIITDTVNIYQYISKCFNGVLEDKQALSGIEKNKLIMICLFVGAISIKCLRKLIVHLVHLKIQASILSKFSYRLKELVESTLKICLSILLGIKQTSFKSRLTLNYLCKVIEEESRPHGNIMIKTMILIYS